MLNLFLLYFIKNWDIKNGNFIHCNIDNIYNNRPTIYNFGNLTTGYIDISIEQIVSYSIE